MAVRLLQRWVLAGVLVLPGAPALAQEAEQLKALRDTTLRLIELLVEQGILTRAKADALLAEASRQRPPNQALTPAAPPATGAATGATAAAVPATGAGQPLATAPQTVRVPYVPQSVRNEIRDEIRKEVLAQAKSEGWAAPNALPDWVRGLKVSGDLLLRLEDDLYSAHNTDPATYQAITGDSIANTTQNQFRFRFQARLGVETTFSESIGAGLRLASGSIANPGTVSQTFGNSFNRYQFALDRAFMRYRGGSAFEAVGGRFGNPFYGSDMVWSPLLSFDGIALKATPYAERSVRPFFTAGAFPVQDIGPSPSTLAKSKWLYGYQSGVTLDLPAHSLARAAAGLYDYRNVEGKADQSPTSSLYDQTTPLFLQKGNSLFYVDTNNTVLGLASRFRELNLTAEADYGGFDPIHVGLQADFVRNIGFNRAEILARTGLPDIQRQVNGYQVRLTVGYPQILKRGDWQAWLAYRRLEKDAVLDAFNDQDFHLGGTDTRGYMLGFQYGLNDSMWLRLRWFNADQISGPPLSIDTLMADLYLRF